MDMTIRDWHPKTYAAPNLTNRIGIHVGDAREKVLKVFTQNATFWCNLDLESEIYSSLQTVLICPCKIMASCIRILSRL